MPTWGYRAAWLLCLSVTFCHIVSLPLVVSFDSTWYVYLADILGTPRFPGSWDFLRTPIFPALLKFAFWLWGRQAMAVFALQSCLACAGVWFLSRTVRVLGLHAESAIAVAVLAAFPTFVAYQHVLMTEIGSFFFFSLVVCLLAWPSASSLMGAMWLALALALGYYHRSSLLYLAPPAGAIYVLTGLKEEWKQPGRAFGNRVFRQLLPQFLVVAFFPFVLAYPWQSNPRVAVRNGQGVLLYGLVTQAVFPPNDPILGSAAQLYASAIEQSKLNGVLPNEGITGGRQYAVLRSIYGYGSAASLFLHEIETNPLNYLHAVDRNLVMFSGLAGSAYDNAQYRQRVLCYLESFIDPGAPQIPPLGNEFKRTVAPSLTSLALRQIAPFYDWMVDFGLLATILAFLLGLWRLDKAILAFTAPTLAFMGMHALLLMSQDRMILPVQPVLLLNLIMLPAWLGLPRWLSSRWTLVLRSLDLTKTN
jgi:hypothetical protein